ncbi:MAG: cation diffusion facilitator family transporter [Ignavibacteriaceae bacterium]
MVTRKEAVITKKYSAKEASRISARTTLLGIITSFILVIIKGTAGILGNSFALVADAIESVSDIFTSFVVLAGVRVAAKPPDENHPYGHGKAETIAAIVVAFGIFNAALVIIYNSIHEILTPHHAPAPFTLIVLVLVVLTKEILFRFVLKTGMDVESLAVKNDAWHHRSDAITSTAAFIGIAIALIGGPGYEEADDWAALFASGIIIYNAYKLFKPALYDLTDAAPEINIDEEVVCYAKMVEGVKGIDKCFVRKMGFDLFVDIHVVVNGKITVNEGHLIGHNVKDKLIETNPRIKDVLVHIEPDDIIKDE